MITLSKILETMPDQSSRAKELVEKAWKYSVKAHSGQKRLSGEPYITHPANVAHYLAEIGMCKETIAAGLLHDTLEDTNVTPGELEKEFGKEVRTLAEGVTRLGFLKYKGREEYAENLRRLFVATAQDLRTIIIKLADRLHNMKTLKYHNNERQERKAMETLKVYAPVARRLGMSDLKKELEDLSFSYLNPEEYKKIVDIYRSIQNDKKQVRSIAKQIVREFARHGIKSYVEVKSKGLFSLYEKLKRKGGNLSQINDLFTISVIVPEVAHCYRALGIINNKWKPLPKEIKDFIAFPKPTGYQAINTTIFRKDSNALEIQIATEEMYLRAKYGIAFYFAPRSFHETLSGRSSQSIFSPKRFLYYLHGLFSKDKEEIEKGNVENKIPAWIERMVNIQEKIQKPDEFIKSLSDDFFEHRIFVFNSKGDLIDLPIDSSPIDYAYMLGQNVGNHLNSVKVNHEEVTLSSKLKNGDIVEVETKPEAAPAKSWLRHAKTANAKQLINLYLHGAKNHNEANPFS